MKSKILQIVGLAIIVVAAWWVIDAVRTADRAERCLHACITTTDILEQYVKVTGQWPSSWNDLQQTVESAKYCGIHRWPDDVSKIQGFVYVDFDADLESLATASPKSFDAVRPIGPCYSSYDRHFQFLINAARESQTE